MADCVTSAIVSTDAAVDALSAPSGDDLLPPILALLPRGAAWGTPDDAAPDPDRLMSRYWGAYADVQAEHYARLQLIKAESTTVTMVSSLEDWETELGLPDPCYGADQSLDTRLRAVRARLIGQQVDGLDGLECLATALGYTATARRADLPFRVGSRTGDPLGDPDGVFWVIITISALGPAVRFRIGSSRVGDRITDLPQATDLECAIDRAKPAEWSIRYTYS